MKIHIFFNRPPVVEPMLWGDHQNPDEYKLAFVAAETWREKGFDPIFIRSTDVSLKRRLQTFTGQLKDTVAWWKMDMMQLWGRCSDLLEGTDDWITLACTDILNRQLTPHDVTMEIRKAQIAGKHCVNWTEIHVSCALLSFNQEFADNARQCLSDYDYGLLPLIEGNQVSDETVIRTYMQKEIHQARVGVRYAMANAGWQVAPAIHVSRSVLQHIPSLIPTA